MKHIKDGLRFVGHTVTRNPVLFALYLGIIAAACYWLAAPSVALPVIVLCGAGLTVWSARTFVQILMIALALGAQPGLAQYQGTEMLEHANFGRIGYQDVAEDIIIEILNKTPYRDTSKPPADYDWSEDFRTSFNVDPYGPPPQLQIGAGVIIGGAVLIGGGVAAYYLWRWCTRPVPVRTNNWPSEESFAPAPEDTESETAMFGSIPNGGSSCPAMADTEPVIQTTIELTVTAEESKIRVIPAASMATGTQIREAIQGWGLSGNGWQSTRADLQAGPGWFTYEPDGVETRDVIIERSSDLDQWELVLEAVLPEDMPLVLTDSSTDLQTYYRVR